MKRILFMIICFTMFIKVNALDLAANAKSAIIIESSTKKIIFEKNSNERLYPASMTKMMTLLLTMEALDSGKISLTDKVNISSNASSMGGSQMFLEANSTVPLEDIIKGVAIASANDGAVALAEYIGGSVENFVEMMNKKATDLGLTNTHFVNPHGLHDDNHYSSSYDMAIIALNLIKHNTILKYSSIYEDYFNNPNGQKYWLVNTNKLVKFYSGVDGLKTGYTKEAGYCLTATAKKNNLRYITVVMGEPTSDLRSSDTTGMLNYAFNSFKLNTIISKDNSIGNILIEKTKDKIIPIYVEEDITELLSKDKETNNYSYNIKLNKVNAPINKGSIVGTVEILDNEGLIVREENLIINEDVKKTKLINIIIENFLNIIRGKKIYKI